MRGGLRPPVLDAILYALRAGCAWRLRPREYPAAAPPRWQTVYRYLRAWERDATWQRVHEGLRRAARVGVELRVVRRPERHRFVVIPRRWIVERTFAWLGRNRRLAEDYEARPQTTAVLMAVATIGPTLRRLARRC
jgi:transposase